MMKKSAAASALALVLAGGSTLALAKGDHKHGKHDEERAERHHERAEEIRVGAFFRERDREAARHYYARQGRPGHHCPPGLAKKHNGCMPPGQAIKYSPGQSLPPAVVYYPVPQPVLVQLPPPPVGHSYIRIGADIMLFKPQGRLVVDVLTGL